MNIRRIFLLVSAIGGSPFPATGILLETGFPNFILLEDNSYILLE